MPCHENVVWNISLIRHEVTILFFHFFSCCTELNVFLSTNKLRALRAEKGWSQEVVAKSTGLSVRTIQRVEADGKASPESTLALASVFDLSPKELENTTGSVEVNWKKRIIMKNFSTLIIVLGVIYFIMFVGAKIFNYIDGISFLYLALFMYGTTAITFGNDGLLKSLQGLKYLFTDELVGGAQAQYLSKLFQSQIKFCYGGSLIGLLVGSIAIHTNVDSTGFTLHRAYAVNIIVLFYAAIFCEVILRPLSIKLKVCDIPQ